LRGSYDGIAFTIFKDVAGNFSEKKAFLVIKPFIAAKILHLSS
jgi:hypothetical protein